MSSRKNLLLALLLLSLVTTQLSRHVAGTSIHVEVKDDSVFVKVESNLFQNMTGLPQLGVDVLGSDLVSARLAFQEALRSKFPLNVSSLSMRVICHGVWLNVTASFTVDGIAKTEQDVVMARLSWLPFKVTSDLRAANLSYSLVGSKHLLPAIEAMSDRTGVKYFSPAFTPIDLQMARGIASNFTMFDLTPIKANMSLWLKSFDANSMTTTWYTDRVQTFDLRIEVPQGASNLTFYASTDTQAKVSVQGHGTEFGDIVMVEAPTSRQEMIMLGTISGLALLSAMFYRYERRIAKTMKR